MSEKMLPVLVINCGLAAVAVLISSTVHNAKLSAGGFGIREKIVLNCRLGLQGKVDVAVG